MLVGFSEIDLVRLLRMRLLCAEPYLDDAFLLINDLLFLPFDLNLTYQFLISCKLPLLDQQTLL